MTHSLMVAAENDALPGGKVGGIGDVVRDVPLALAERAGQPCLVHHVGGLRDTVHDKLTGFAFRGADPTEQADQLVATLQRALTVYNDHPEQWQSLRQASAAARFRWADSIDAYLQHLYRQPSRELS